MELIDLKEGEGFYANCSLKGYLLNNAYIHRKGNNIYIFSDEKNLNGGHNSMFLEKRFKEMEKKCIWNIGKFNDIRKHKEEYRFKLINFQDVYELW